MPDAAKIIKDWCASCGMPEPSDGECHALAVAISAAAPVVLPETVPTPCRSMFATQREYADAMVQHRKIWAEVEADCALLATGGQAQADMPDSFREWFAKNYPADTIIVDPDWHAKSIFRMAQAHARLAAPQAQADARDAVEFWGVMAPCGEGVIFNNEADARWTLTGHGSGSDGFGVPTIGEAFRECYEDEELELVRVHIAAIAAAKGE